MANIRRFDPTAVPVEPVERPESDANVWTNRMYTSEDGRQFHGVWQADPGVHANIPGQETVVVLSGRATVTDAEGTSIDVGPGDLVFLDAGAVTTWTVHEQLRKVFVINAA